MKYGIYAVRDNLIGYLSITLEQNDPAALRDFSAAVNSPDSRLFVKPEDYRLYRVGTFDTDTGIIEAESSPSLIGEGGSLMRKEVENGK